MQTNYETREATWADVPRLCHLLEEAAEEQGAGYEIDYAHAQSHIVAKLEKGVAIVLEAAGEIVGAVTLSKVDLGYRYDDSAFETTHTFVLRRSRSMRAMRALFAGVEAYADRKNVVILFHQLWYRQAIRNEAMDDGRFDTLYRFLGYREAGASLAQYPSSDILRKVGRTYIYVPGMDKVRRRGHASKPPSATNGSNGAGEAE